MTFRVYLVLFAVLLLVAACVPVPQAAPLATAASSQGVPSGWQTYTNTATGFSISYPTGWRQSDLPPTATTHGVSLDGPEGTVELYWGTGFGGPCPQPVKIKAAQGDLPACYSVAANGVQHWDQINKELSTTSFSGRAFTKDGQPASGATVLAVLATLTFAGAGS